MCIKTIFVRTVPIYIEEDEAGYISLSTSGYLPGERLDEIIKILHDAQDDDDRELGVVHRPHHVVE